MSIFDLEDHEDRVDAVAAWLYDGERRYASEFAAMGSKGLMEYCSVEPEDSTYMILVVNTYHSQIDDKAGALAFLEDGNPVAGIRSRRIDKLLEADDPEMLTDKEFALIQECECEDLPSYGAAGDREYYCRVSDRKGRGIYFSSEHSDGGACIGCGGPEKFLTCAMDGYSRGIYVEHYPL